MCLDAAMFACCFLNMTDLFLSSAQPTAALEMRRDLGQLDQALKLAGTLAPDTVPEVC